MLIFLVFIVLHLFNILSVGINNIKENWPIYRCNPMVMPFAGIFGHDSGENFTYCVQNMQTDYMSHLLQPVNYNIDIIGEMGAQLGDAVNNARGFISSLRTMIGDIVGSIFGVFLNILIHFQRIMMNVKDMMGKIAATMSSLVYILQGSLMTMTSAWAGPAGQIIRSVCFHPDTIIQLQNKEFVKMKDIQLGDILKNGTKVDAVMKISNIDEKGHYIEKLYAIRDGEQEEKILVTGSHLVYDPILRTFVKVKDLLGRSEVVDNDCREFSCLITSSHTIPIGKWIFHDWEDNNGVPIAKI